MDVKLSELMIDCGLLPMSAKDNEEHNAVDYFIKNSPFINVAWKDYVYKLEGGTVYYVSAAFANALRQVMNPPSYDQDQLHKGNYVIKHYYNIVKHFGVGTKISSKNLANYIKGSTNMSSGAIRNLISKMATKSLIVKDDISGLYELK